jgi:ABC-2 type transport system permease protein
MSLLVRTLLRGVLTRGRVVGLVALGLVAPLLGLAIGASSQAQPLEDGALMVNAFGLSLFVPVVTLVFASAALGDPNEDGTLVYLWLRPVARWRLAVAAVVASLIVALPLVVLPLVLAAAATGAGGDLVLGTVVACAVGTLAYGGMFTWLGLRVRRALVWGVAYVLVWEGFVARAGIFPARLAIRTHTGTLLSRMAGGYEPEWVVATTTAVLVPLAVLVVAVALTARRLVRQDVA